MKYLYKKHKKKLLMLFFLLPAAFAAVAQVPGTPYGLSDTYRPATFPSGPGLFAGRTCFDVAQENDAGECGNLIARKAELITAKGSRADFTNPLTSSQTYKFTPSGNVSNVRFYFVEAEGYRGQIIESVTGGNPGIVSSTDTVTFVVVYKNDLNGKAKGKSQDNALTVDIYAVYYDHSNLRDEAVKLTVMIRDCACCGAYTPAGFWTAFMCYNLGADPTLTTPDLIKNSSLSSTSGYLYQWGKKKAWPATGDVDGWASGINNDPDSPGGNRDPAAWGRLSPKGIDDPCPEGWRVPNFLVFSALGMTKTTGAPLYSSFRDPEYVWYSATPTPGLQLGNTLFLPSVAARSQTGVLSGEGYYHTDIGDDMEITNLVQLTPTYAKGSHIYKSGAAPVRCVADKK